MLFWNIDNLGILVNRHGKSSVLQRCAQYQKSSDLTKMFRIPKSLTITKKLKIEKKGQNNIISLTYTKVGKKIHNYRKVHNCKKAHNCKKVHNWKKRFRIVIKSSEW